MEGFMPISMADRAQIEQVLANNPTQASEFTFAYLYMWQCDFNFQYVIQDGWLLIISESGYDIPFALCPLPVSGVFEPAAFHDAINWLRVRFELVRRPLVFGRVEEKHLSWFNTYPCAEFTIERSDRTADYLYDGDALRELAGRKYSAKRNHISQFIRRYPDYEIVEIDASHLDACREIFELWCRERNCECDSPESCERYACDRLLDVWDELNLRGILLRVDGRFEAFTIGEAVRDDTVVIRFEKANSQIHGLYTVLNRDFLVRDWMKMTAVNREEDMGIEGLRKAKQSYHPCRMIQKYTLFLQY